MTKTPEQMAREFANDDWGEQEWGAYCGFLAGYQAAKDSQEYLMNEMIILRNRLDTAEKLSQLVDEEKEQ